MIEERSIGGRSLLDSIVDIHSDAVKYGTFSAFKGLNIVDDAISYTTRIGINIWFVFGKEMSKATGLLTDTNRGFSPSLIPLKVTYAADEALQIRTIL